MGDCLKNLFVQQFDSFMAEHGYTQNINCFSKLYNDIFARVYLFYHYDKNYDELQFDVILLIQFVTSDLSVASAIYSSPDKRLNEKSSSPS